MWSEFVEDQWGRTLNSFQVTVSYLDQTAFSYWGHAVDELISGGERIPTLQVTW